MSLWNNPPFYITAYGLAVKHGYRGSEEQWLADLRYPVGAIYLSTDGTNPNNHFGGTWVEIEDKVLVTAGSSYTAGDVVSISTETESGSSVDALVVHAWKRTK
ncbi:MAG: hypothetical protein IKI35_05720 [Stomatobaculum sp.]|nr:hypothetical protein [Stomatobaculum sp.]